MVWILQRRPDAFHYVGMENGPRKSNILVCNGISFVGCFSGYSTDDASFPQTA